MTGPEHLAQAAEYIARYDRLPPGGLDLATCVGLAMNLGAALVHAVIAHTIATVSDEDGIPLSSAWELP